MNGLTLHFAWTPATGFSQVGGSYACVGMTNERKGSRHLRLIGNDTPQAT
jgi:hypothetical protein